MNSSDVRIVRLIPTTTDGSFTGGGGSFCDQAGVLQTAPPNTLRVTYDPSDLRKAPHALIEPEARNAIRNNTMQGAVVGSPGVMPTGWARTALAGITPSITSVGQESGIDYIDVRYTGEAQGQLYIAFDDYSAQSVDPGQQWALSFYHRLVSGSLTNVTRARFRLREGTLAGGYVQDNLSNFFPFDSPLNTQRTHVLATMSSSSQVVGGGIVLDISGAIEFTLRIGLPQLERDRVTSPIKTSNGAVTRAADVIGAGAGLVASNVPVTEPLWAAGTTYAAKAQVRDAANIVYESLVASNVGNDPALPANSSKWLKLGATNRWKAFDRAVNSQTSAPGMLTFSVKPGALANTLMLLNVEGASVTVSQSESGYVRTQRLVKHDVLSWYDFYYEEPVRAGAAVFEDLPPYPGATVTVAVDNGTADAKVGACLFGKYRVIGKATSSLTAGVLSYSTSTADTWGNVTMMRRHNAPRQNFDVLIPAGFESEAYRILRQYTDVEIGIIIGDRYEMGIGYGFLGQWDIPKSGNGRTAPIEFKGLV